MEVFILHILKLNIIAAIVILLVKVLATLFKGRVSARWKYFIWLLITISLCVPVRLPENLALVDFKVLRSSQQNTQSPKITDYAVRPEESQKITETVSSASNDMKNLTEIPEQKRTVRYESDKWLGIVALIFAAVWLSVAVLKLTGESDVPCSLSKEARTQNTGTQAKRRSYHTASCRTFTYKIVSTSNRVFSRRKKTYLLP